MHPVDSLRDRIRAKQQTSNLGADKASETMIYEADDTLFQKLQEEPPAEQPLQGLKLSFLEKFKPMEINKKMLALSLAVAAFASFLSMNYLNSIVNPLKEQSRMIKILMVTRDIPARTMLKKEMLTIKQVPYAYIPQGAIEYDPGIKILGKVALTSLYKGEILNTHRIALPNETTGLAMTIPEGHRAVTIRANNANLMKPTDHVDLIASIADLNPIRRGKVITIPVLQRVQILAVGTQFSAEAEKSNASAYQSITLAVPEERVNLMSILEEKGNFKVVLRAPEDTSIMPEKYTIQEIEDALLGKFEAAKTVDTTDEEKPAIKPAVLKEEPEEEIKDEPLVDLSEPAPVQKYAPTYRRTVTPRRQPLVRNYSTPPRRPTPRIQNIQPTAPKPAAPRVRNTVPSRPKVVNVINGGNLTQVNGGTE